MTLAVPFLNLDPTAHLVGWSNEASVIVDRQKVTALINLRAQVSNVSFGFLQSDGPEGPSSRQVARARGYWSSAIPYLRYIEVNLEIPGIRDYNEDVLLLVILTMTYSNKVPVMVGSKIIDRAMEMSTKGKLARETAIWKQTNFSAVMSGSLQLPHKGTGAGVL